MSLYYSDEHVTLYHGDAFHEKSWLSADVLVTDPPYGMGYTSGRVDGRPRSTTGIQNDKTTGARDKALEIWGDRPALAFGTWKRPRPERTRQLIVWDKRGGQGYSGNLKMPWADVTEEIYVLGNGWIGGMVPAIYSIPSYNSQAKARPDHPTPKPVDLMENLLQKCPPGVIADPFAGSGATLIAAANLGRKAIGVELEERYCEIIANRLSQSVLDLGAIA